MLHVLLHSTSIKFIVHTKTIIQQLQALNKSDGQQIADNLL